MISTMYSKTAYVLNTRFTTNGICVKNNTDLYVV